MFHGGLFDGNNDDDNDDNDDDQQQSQQSSLPGVDAGREFLSSQTGGSLVETGKTILDPNESLVGKAQQKVAAREARQEPTGPPGGQQTGREVIQRPANWDERKAKLQQGPQTVPGDQTVSGDSAAVDVFMMRRNAPDSLPTSSDPDPDPDTEDTETAPAKAARNDFEPDGPTATTNGSVSGGQLSDLSRPTDGRLPGTDGSNADSTATWSVDWSSIGGRL